MEFKNRLNEEAELVDGRIVWLSRASAIVAVILIKVKDETYVLTEKRSEIMDEPNKWAVPSGYLDWDENGLEGIIREVYEETSFFIPDYEDSVVHSSDQPFYVHSDPWSDAKQNVSLSYLFMYKMDRIPREVEQFKDKEIAEVKWVNVEDIFSIGDWAFDHDRRIQMALNNYGYILV